MCGFVVVVSKERKNLNSALNSIAHRGPDDEGFATFKLKSGKFVSLGFRRLGTMSSLPNGKQPFIIEGRYAVVFNGAIYNYREVREKLIAKGLSFKTDVDTEVLVRAYEYWGEQCYQYLKGMWASIIFDIEHEEIVVSRDRFGIKPLYYSFSASGDIVLASEIKAIFKVDNNLNNTNNQYLLNYLKYGFIHYSTETVFKNINICPSSSFSVYKLDSNAQNFVFRKYWSLKKNSVTRSSSFDENCQKFTLLWEEVIDLYLTADFEIGSCLSGGLDSSSIVATVANKFQKNIKTFTLGFEESEVNELSYARAITDSSDKIDSTFVTFSSRQVLDLVEEMYEYHDQPFPDFSIVGQWKVMSSIKADGLRIVFDGQGGDELLAGYRKYYAFYIKSLFRNGSFITAFREISILFSSKHINFWNLEGIKKYLGFRVNNDLFSRGNVDLEIPLYRLGANDLDDVFNQDIFKFSYPPLLAWEDTNSMAHGIESRVPFMDYELVEFLYNVPVNHKIRFGYTKTLLREALKGILPDKIYRRKSKLGFSTPQNEWMLDREFRDDMLQRLELVEFDEIVNVKEFKRDLGKMSKNKQHNNMLVRIYLYLIWKNRKKCVV